MGISLGFEIFLLIVFIVLHAFFALAETSILNVRRSRLKEMIDDEEVEADDKATASILLDLKHNVESFVATTQCGAVFSSFLVATSAALIAYNDLSPSLALWLDWNLRTATIVAFLLAIMGGVTLDLTFGALIPKSVALQQSQRFAFLLGGVVRAMVKWLKPITHLPVVISNIFLKPFRDHTSFTESRVSEEELRVMLEEGARSGVIDKTENELIENIFDFRERTVREVMVPRTSIVAVDLDTPRELLVERIISEGYTRLPVYHESIENIIGVIYSKDVLALIQNPHLIVLHDIIRPAPFVPETKQLSELLREFQEQKLHMAVVVDEYGGTAGIVTLEDIVEEIVGEIHDEYDEDIPSVVVDEEKKLIEISADLAIPDANMHLEPLFTSFHIPEDEDYESVSGYVNKLFGYIPETGEEKETMGVKISVLKSAPNRVLQVRLQELYSAPRTPAAESVAS
jgi:CBS domain containing-hemolysin-like protein